ncbi:MAG: hypothetical protein E2P06_12775 [Acidobacteria bacterium]|nr:MAG: hypothetical protein E2P06_12775 [Acidobacteriota bacterium]
MTRRVTRGEAPGLGDDIRRGVEVDDARVVGKPASKRRGSIWSEMVNPRGIGARVRPRSMVEALRVVPARCLVVRSRLLLGVLAALFLASGDRPRAGAVQTDFWLTPALAPYRALIDAYRDGRTEEAIDGVRVFEVEDIHQIVDTVRDQDTRVTGTDRDPAPHQQLFRAAAMLHVDTADDLWSIGLASAATSHIEVAIRWADLGARRPEPDGSFRRRWYLGVGLLVFERGGWRAALSFVDLACEALPDDVPLLTTAAWLNEQGALAPVRLRDARVAGVRAAQGAKRDGLRAAARRARAALAVAPDATEAALRLARVRMLLEDVGSARELLLGLVGRTDLPTPHAYLARLMLGHLYAQAAEPERAERLFREASDLITEGQAARVALGQLLDTLGDRRGAAVVLEPILTAKPGGLIDPWVDYLMGARNGPALRAALRAEVRR